MSSGVERSANMHKIEVDSGKMEMLSRELGKLQCWLTGYHAGKGNSANMLGAGIPGADSVRQAKLLFRDMVQAASAPAVVPEATVADEEGWIIHDGKGMPIDGKTKVGIKCRDGYVGEEWAEDVNDSGWWKFGEGHKGDEIVAYKIISP